MKIAVSSFWVVVLFSTCNLLFAQSVSVDHAKRIAGTYLSAGNLPLLKSTGAEKIEQQLSSISVLSSQNDTLYFILNDTINDGFVIVSADKRAWPILGYSLEGTCDTTNQPPAFIWWMENRKKEIEYLKQHNIVPDSKVNQQWDNLEDTAPMLKSEGTSVAPLLKTTWDQGCYYNGLCPANTDGPCGRVWAGCVATAMAQIMKYWSFPSTGNGSYSYTHSTYGVQSANFGATTYQWSQMPNNVTSANNAVATLLYHCGVAVNMNYSPTGSGAGEPSDELINYFKYSSKTSSVYKEDYTENDWINLLKSELQLLRPIWYRGDDGTSGHAFVCDGYDANDNFHINWGWSGYYNGYFLLGSLNPGSYSFNLDQGAIIRLIPTSMPDGYDGFFLSENNIEMSANGENNSLDVFSSANWTASSNQSWLTLNINTGASGKTTLVVTASENTTASERSASITITATGFSSQTVSVSQSAKVAVTAGQLHNVLSGELETTSNLTLTGTLDARDFKTMRDEMPLLAKIDLRNVTILAYTGTLGPVGTYNNSYPANAIPEFAFVVSDTWTGKHSLTSFVCPSSLTSIGNYSFVFCRGLTSFEIPALVSSIGFSAFYGCNKMTSINIPASVNYIGNDAFYNCTGLTSIRSYSPTPIDLSSKTGIFTGVNKTNCTLYVPFGSLGLYATATQWQDFLNIAEVPGLKLSSTAARVGASLNSTASITLQSNTQWTASSNQSWLSINPLSGTGNATLVFTAEANPLHSERITTITVSAPGTEPQTVELTQEASTGPIINENLALSDAYIVNNPRDCYNAIQTITLAGNSSTLTLESGSTVTLIAGQSIRFLPGFHAENGSEVNAWITTNGTFCDGTAASPLVLPNVKSTPDIIAARPSNQTEKEKDLKVYPNPNNGEFTIELTGFNLAELQLCNLTGRIIYHIKQVHQKEIALNLSHLEQGIYLLKASDQNNQIVKKIIISK